MEQRAPAVREKSDNPAVLFILAHLRTQATRDDAVRTPSLSDLAGALGS